MGYTTRFTGSFLLDTPLQPEHSAYLKRFSETRRMKRKNELLQKMPDPLREAAGLPLGPEGAYYVGSRDPHGQDYEHPSVLDENEPPQGQPGLWCHWTPTEDKKGICWNGEEKFYHYGRWLEYLIEHFLYPWGYRMEGALRWQGQDKSDQGTLYALCNEVFILSDEALHRALFSPARSDA